MRLGFERIVSGWELDKPAELAARIEWAKIWSTADNGILPDEAKLLATMIELSTQLDTDKIVDGMLRRAGFPAEPFDPFDCYRSPLSSSRLAL